MTQENKEPRIEVTKMLYELDMYGNTITTEVRETCYFNEWTDFDD